MTHSAPCGWRHAVCFFFVLYAIFVTVIVLLSTDQFKKRSVYEHVKSSSYIPVARISGHYKTKIITAGAAGTLFKRRASPNYINNGLTIDKSLPNARNVSNGILNQDVLTDDPKGNSDMVKDWGQFIDHLFTLTLGGGESCPVDVPTNDTFFDPNGFGNVTLSFSRSKHVIGSHPRAFRNAITHWIDASNVYGSDDTTANELRTGDDKHKKCELKMSHNGEFLATVADTGVHMAHVTDQNAKYFYAAGDIRANEQWGLLALHTLFARVHNKKCRELRKAFYKYDEEDLYEGARSFVRGVIQKITLEEYLPQLIGLKNTTLTYKTHVIPNLSLEFVTSIFRVGHSQVSPNILLVDSLISGPGSTLAPLRTAFFQPLSFKQHGFNAVIRGLAQQCAQKVDVQIVDELRNFLFGAPGAGGHDLAVLNIMRGRDHGMPSYNDMRVAYGLPKKTSLADVTSDVAVQQKLAKFYTIDTLEAWIGGLAEDHVSGSTLGELFTTAVKEEILGLMEADPHFYQFTALGAQLKGITLQKLILENSDISTYPENPFVC